MHVQEKQAWFILIVFAITVGLYILGVALIGGFGRGVEGVFGLMGLTGFAGLIGRKERQQGTVIMDERDIQIERFSTLAGYSVFWVIFVLATMIPFLWLGPQAKITLPATLFPISLGIAGAIIFLVKSVVVIVLYRRGSRADA